MPAKANAQATTSGEMADFMFEAPQARRIRSPMAG
jgi:hypothetical protein